MKKIYLIFSIGFLFCLNSCSKKNMNLSGYWQGNLKFTTGTILNISFVLQNDGSTQFYEGDSNSTTKLKGTYTCLHDEQMKFIVSRDLDIIEVTATVTKNPASVSGLFKLTKATDIESGTITASKK